MPTVSFEVYGRVQGVGFRFFAQGLAERLGVTGEVWNRHNGTVAMTARHDDPAILAAFEAGLKQGPGRVDRVAASEAPEAVFDRFEIVSSRF